MQLITSDLLTTAYVASQPAFIPMHCQMFSIRYGKLNFTMVDQLLPTLATESQSVQWLFIATRITRNMQIHGSVISYLPTYTENTINTPATELIFLTALISKINLALEQNEDHINLLGTGEPLRQFMYAGDLARAIMQMIQKGVYPSCNICPSENLSIHELAKIALEVVDATHLDIRFNGNKSQDGQYRKDASNELFMKAFPDFKFTSLKHGLRQSFKC